jgi:hypothetical protein
MDNKKLTLYEKDKYLKNIQEQIMLKRQLLLNNQQKINKTSQQNHFLEEIKSDYINYHCYIIKQKQDQTNALKLLDMYMIDLKNTEELSKINKKTIKHEQLLIVNEINNIKKELDELTKITKITI